MPEELIKDIANFFVVGLNYKKTDASLRGKFAINPTQYQILLDKGKESPSASFFILSTCNRTEIFGFGNSSEELGKFLCSATEGSFSDFEEMSYSFQGRAAITHLFKVASGIDSQILGDYEVTAQIKMAVKQSKASGLMNNFLERLVNEVFACTKLIRTNTAFSSGTVSVSFAAIQLIKEKFAQEELGKILLIGAGKIGSNTAKNILHYIPRANLTIVNRTNDRAINLAASTGATTVDFDSRSLAVNEAQVIIVATQATEPVLTATDLDTVQGPKLLIDLSVPCNIDKDVLSVVDMELIGVDELSKVNDQTLLNRKSEIPKVMAQIDFNMNLFYEWYEQRLDAKKLKRLKTHLQQLTTEVATETLGTSSIQKTVNGMAKKLKSENTAGCFYLQALNEYISTNTN